MAAQGTEPQLSWASEHHLRLDVGSSVSGRTQLDRALSAIEQARVPGIVDITPAKTTLVLEFDLAGLDEQRAIDAVRRALKGASDEPPPARPTTIEIPVCYESSYAPDAEEVARLGDITCAELIRLHSEASYRVEFIGFAPGFGYLSGLPEQLHTPRLDAPRMRVPAGSVGIAADQTGVYPGHTAGGWRLIGRTPLRMFDANRTRPSLLARGDTVRFVPISCSAGFQPAFEDERQQARMPAPQGSAIRVISPGMLSSVQDLGRSGYSAIGVGRGGAADTLSIRVGNRLVGNDDGAAAIEMTWTGGTFEFGRDAIVVLAGGNVHARIENSHATRAAVVWEPLRIQSGERLVVGPILSGARCYLCVAGGIAVPVVLGSRSTHLVGVFGGTEGRALRAGDVLPIGSDRAGEPVADLAARARDYCNSTLARRTLRAVNGAHHECFNREAVETFWKSTFEISLKSDRAGLRLIGRVGPSPFDGRMASEGMMPGALQVPESGEPIVLLADHPTTGGYPVIACVATVDHAVLGQVRPGEKLGFERVSIEEAQAQYRAQEQALDAAIPPRRRKETA